MKNLDIPYLNNMRGVITHAENDYLVESDKLVCAENIEKAAHLYARLKDIDRDLALIIDELEHITDGNCPTKGELLQQLHELLCGKGAFGIEVPVEDDELFGLSTNDIPVIVKVWEDDAYGGIWYLESHSDLYNKIENLPMNTLIEIIKQLKGGEE